MGKKVLVTMDEALLELVDRAASARGMTRSAFLSDIAERSVMSAHVGAEAEAAVRRLRDLAAETPPAEDPTITIRRMRDSR